MRKFTHKIFHLDRNSDRDSLVDAMESLLAGESLTLDTPTISISNRDDLDLFMSECPEFNPDRNGVNLHGEQGWKYGELGIWASNFTAWKKFLESDSEYLILMEDDIIPIGTHFMSVLDVYLNELPRDWDIFHYFCPSDQFGKYNEHLRNSDSTCEAYQDWSCLCYVVTRAGAQKLIDSMSPSFYLPLDWQMFRQKHLFNIFTVTPHAVKSCDIAPIESTFQTVQKRNPL